MENNSGKTFIEDIKKRDEIAKQLSAAKQKLQWFMSERLREICEMLVFKQQIENAERKAKNAQEGKNEHIAEIELWDFAEPTVEYFNYTSGAAVKVTWKEDYDHEFRKYDRQYSIIVPVADIEKSEEEIERDYQDLKEIEEKRIADEEQLQAFAKRESDRQTYERLKKEFEPEAE